MYLGKNKVKEVTVEAVKVLADGTRVPLGVVASYHSNPFKRWYYNLKRIISKWLQ